MLKFYVKHGKSNEKIHGIISSKQTKCLKIYISVITQRRIRAENEFEKDFYKLLNNAFYGKTMENVRNRLRLEFIKKKIIKNYKTTI